MEKFKVLFLNHKKKQCGVYQYGIRLFKSFENTESVEYFYKELDCLTEYQEINPIELDFIIYNYHECTMSWLNDDNIYKNIKNIGIMHETTRDIFDIKLNLDPTFQDCDHHYSIPRPMYHNVDDILENYQPSTKEIKDFINYRQNEVPVFGSFGFAQWHKKFEKIVQLVNAQYDKAIIKFVTPVADFIPNSEILISQNYHNCVQYITKPGIQLIITKEFFTNEDILCFLRSNDMNIFLYESDNGYPSSVIDYALPAKKPIGISGSVVFKHVYSDDICPYKNTLEHCMQKSIDHCSQFLESYSKENMNKRFMQIFQENFNKEIEMKNAYLQENTIKTLEKGYSNASPFPFEMIDNFLQKECLDKIKMDVDDLNRYPPDGADVFKSTVNNKFVYEEHKFGKHLKELVQYLISREFVEYLEKLTGIKELVSDDFFYGGGIHKIANKGFLAIHTDFNMYNNRKHGILDRRINLLLYLNDYWQENYNGHLILCDKTTKKACYKITPIKNRCVIFNTTNKSLHGHPELLDLPPGRMRMRESLALYYYTKNNDTLIDFEGDVYHGTICYDWSDFDTSTVKLV